MNWWDTLSRPPTFARPARGAHVADLSAAEFVVCESVKHSRDRSKGDAGESFAHMNALAKQMLAARGSGFESVVRRGPDGGRLDAAWLTTRSYVCDRATGHIAAAAHLNHSLMDLPPGLDLGAITGHSRPGSEEAPAGMQLPYSALYFGSNTTGVLMPMVMGFNVVSVDLWPATGEVAMFESWSSTAMVTVVDHRGQRRLLTVIDGVAGGEHIRYSPDGSWLLLDGNRSWLVNAATGQWLETPVNNADWWPLAPSTLLTLDNETKPTPTPRLYSLEEAAFTQAFPALQLAGSDQTDPDLLNCYNVAVSPDGTELLVGSRVGITSAYQREHGSRQRVARVDLRTGHGALVWPIFLDDRHELEREHDDFRWLHRPAHQSVSLHPDLVAQLRPVNTAEDPRKPKRGAYDARQIVGLVLQHAVTILRQHPESADPSPYLPEIIRGLVTLHDLSPELWQPIGAWVYSISDGIEIVLSHGSLTGRPEDAWRKFRAAAQALRHEQSQLIDWHAVPWLVAASAQ